MGTITLGEGNTHDMLDSTGFQKVKSQNMEEKDPNFTIQGMSIPEIKNSPKFISQGQNTVNGSKLVKLANSQKLQYQKLHQHLSQLGIQNTA